VGSNPIEDSGGTKMRIFIDYICDGKESFHSYTEDVVYKNSTDAENWPRLLARFGESPEYKNVHLTGNIVTLHGGLKAPEYEYTRTEERWYVEVDTIYDILKILKEHEYWVLGKMLVHNEWAIGFTEFEE
jgi:hypothetical protein